jgi:hypothetical protein
MRDKLFGHVSLVYGQAQTYVYAIGGHNGQNPVNQVQRFDGDAWVGPMGAEFQPRYFHSGVVFDGKSGRGDEMWILGGHDESKNDSFDDVWSSNNGSSWVPVAQLKPFAKREQHASVVFDPGSEPIILIIGGYDAGTGTIYKEVLFSNDGSNWNPRTTDPPFGARYGMTAVVDTSRRIWVIGGTDGTKVYDDMWMSNDGANWVEVPGGGDPLTGIERFGHTSLFFDAGKPSIWAIAGFNKLPGLTPMSDVWSSP